jgi:hypothetical protein
LEAINAFHCIQLSDWYHREGPPVPNSAMFSFLASLVDEHRLRFDKHRTGNGETDQTRLALMRF